MADHHLESSMASNSVAALRNFRSFMDISGPFALFNGVEGANSIPFLLIR
jgi:hypothetical protein